MKTIVAEILAKNPNAIAYPHKGGYRVEDEFGSLLCLVTPSPFGHIIISDVYGNFTKI